jgi:hypothetical protein
MIPIPYWLAAHEAGHAVARIHLFPQIMIPDAPERSFTDPSFARLWVGLKSEAPASYHRATQEGPSIIRPLKWAGLMTNVPVPSCLDIEAVVSAAGPMAEARVLKRKSVKHLTGDDLVVVLEAVDRGLDFGDILDKARCLVNRFWPAITVFARRLQSERELSFAQVSSLLRLEQPDNMIDELAWW